MRVDAKLIPSGSVIYAPNGQAGEYAELASNPYTGCGHQCGYCYVVLITKQDRKEFDAGAVPRKDYLIRLRRDAERLQLRGITGQVMLSFLTDVYNPHDTCLTRPTIEILIEHGFAFCVLTKGGTRAGRRELEIQLTLSLSRRCLFVACNGKVRSNPPRLARVSNLAADRRPGSSS